MKPLKNRLPLLLLLGSAFVVLMFTGPTIAKAQQVTERFGDSAATLDVPGVMDDVWFGYYTTNTTTQILYHSYGKPYETVTGQARRNAVRIDLTRLAPGTTIQKAVYVLPLSSKIYPLSSSSYYQDGLHLYQILDPSGTGPWDIATINSRFKSKTPEGTLIPWAVSEEGEALTFATCVDPNPIQTVYGVGRGAVQFYYFDMTDLVRTWVNHPETNMGVTFDGTIISNRVENPHLRPYLEVTYEAMDHTPPYQVAGIEAFHASGQTFVTWQENTYDGQFYDVTYRIYRHTAPITTMNLKDAELVGERHQGSSFNHNRSYRAGEPHTYKIRETDPELPVNTGLFVYTPAVPATAYYAVTFVEEGDENRVDFSVQNALYEPVVERVEAPGAVLQNAWDNNGDTIQEFVHWADATMSYNEGYGFNFMINVDQQYDPQTPSGLEIALTGRTASYRNTWVYNKMVTIWYSDYLPPTKNMPMDGIKDGTDFPDINDNGLWDSLQTWYSGCSTTYKTQARISDGVFVPYTENRILHAIKIAAQRYPIDENRIYLRGGSMGGTGAMSLGLKHPEVFAYVFANVGCPNWRLNIHGIDDAYEVVKTGWRKDADALWGTQENFCLHENGTPIWDWMNEGWYAKNNIQKDLPFLSLYNGKRDGSIVFFPHVAFYRDMWQAKQGFVAAWFDGGHSGGTSFGPRFGTLLKNESFPAFGNVSLDENPGAIHEQSGMTEVVTTDPLVFTGDASGQVNGYRYLEWSRSLKDFNESEFVDDIVDEANRFEMAFRLESMAPVEFATLDITPRRLQRFVVIPFADYYWENKRLSDGQIVQNGRVTADAYGLITVPAFQVEQTALGNKLIVVPASGEEPLAPVLTPIGDRILSPGDALSISVTAYDGNNDPLTFTVIPLPPGAVFDDQTHLFSWTPSAQDAGNFAVTFSVSDGMLSDTETITIAVDGAPPSFTIDTPSGGLTQETAVIPLGGSLFDDVGVGDMTLIVSYPDGTTEERPVQVGAEKWSAAGLYLNTGDNLVTVTATDFLGESSTQSITIKRVTPQRSIVRVATAAELTDAVSTLLSNTEIRIADGTYDIPRTLVVGGTWGNSTLSNVVITSESGNRENVILKGTGMQTSGNTNVLFLFRNIADFALTHLTIKDVYYHPIQCQGENGANRPRFTNLALIDAGEQFIKVTRSTLDALYCNRGIVASCYFTFTQFARHWPSWGYYTDAIDVLGGEGWVIRDNIFDNIRAPHDGVNPDGIAGAVILMWHESKNTLVERNLFWEYDMGIQFGNPSGDAVDHSGGIIRNNFFYRSVENSDVAISLNHASHVKVLHNTVIQNGTFPWTIEYRYQAGDGQPAGLIQGNLTDGPIQSRNSAVAELVDNNTQAEPGWFKDSANGDLHLAAGAPVIDQLAVHPDVQADFDKESRPVNGKADIGADEFAGASSLFDPDQDQDDDVDGQDLHALTTLPSISHDQLSKMAAQLGRIN